MAYVRQRGNQLAIVHGERDQDGKVQQQVLYTIFSKAEALKILDEANAKGGLFRNKLEDNFPNIKFNWVPIYAGISGGLNLLPDHHSNRETRLTASFRKNLIGFTRELLLADPQNLIASAELIKDHEHELQYLKELIEFRLRFKETKETEYNRDNSFYWRFSFQGSDAPPDEEEKAEAHYRRGEYDKAATIFRLLIECFEDYAEGHNYLGLIALAQNRLDEAMLHFQKTMEIGRRKFPKKIAKKRYWRDHSTRPYMRGLRNSIITLCRSGKPSEALTWCDRLENECGDDIGAATLRVSPYIELGRWEEALAAACHVREIDPINHLMGAISLFELGQPLEAVAAFIRGTMHYPRTARKLFGIRNVKQLKGRCFTQVQDHNAGVEMIRTLPKFLNGKERGSRRFFADILRLPAMECLLRELEDAVEAMREVKDDDYRLAFDRVAMMQSEAFARKKAPQILSLATTPTAGAGGERSLTR
jgi:tetratricopeptide (TPR) repeat protein